MCAWEMQRLNIGTGWSSCRRPPMVGAVSQPGIHAAIGQSTIMGQSTFGGQSTIVGQSSATGQSNATAQGNRNGRFKMPWIHRTITAAAQSANTATTAASRTGTAVTYTANGLNCLGNAVVATTSNTERDTPPQRAVPDKRPLLGKPRRRGGIGG